MSNRIKIATFSIRPFEVSKEGPYEKVTQACLDFWQRKFDGVLRDRPDLVVMPECATRPLPYHLVSPEKLRAYYENIGDGLIDLCKRNASDNACTFVCSQIRRLADGKWYNCSTVIGPDGRELGVYCKNHLVIEENSVNGLSYGTKAELIETPFGRIACAICFDLNFEPLREKYVKLKPDLIVFSSMYHGGLQQSIWPYFCRCHFVAAMGSERVPAEIRNPYGRVLHSTTNYFESVVGDVNLDCVVAHLDYNWEKLEQLKSKYGRGVTVLDPGQFGSVMITSETDGLSAKQMAGEFEIELLDDYMRRALECRDSAFNAGRN